MLSFPEQDWLFAESSKDDREVSRMIVIPGLVGEFTEWVAFSSGTEWVAYSGGLKRSVSVQFV